MHDHDDDDGGFTKFLYMQNVELNHPADMAVVHAQHELLFPEEHFHDEAVNRPELYDEGVLMHPSLQDVGHEHAVDPYFMQVQRDFITDAHYTPFLYEQAWPAAPNAGNFGRRHQLPLEDDGLSREERNNAVTLTIEIS